MSQFHNLDSFVSFSDNIFGKFTETHVDMSSVGGQQMQSIRPPFCKESSCTILCQKNMNCLAFKYQENEDDCNCTLISANVYRLPSLANGVKIFIMTEV